MTDTKKSMNAAIGHVKRKINSGEPLTEKTLDTALYVIDATQNNRIEDEFMVNLRQKLINGTPLNEYEHHIMVDVILLHAKFN